MSQNKLQHKQQASVPHLPKRYPSTPQMPRRDRNEDATTTRRRRRRRRTALRWIWIVMRTQIEDLVPDMRGEERRGFNVHMIPANARRERL
jgi:hypothetical protein